MKEDYNKDYLKKIEDEKKDWDNLILAVDSILGMERYALYLKCLRDLLYGDPDAKKQPIGIMHVALNVMLKKTRYHRMYERKRLKLLKGRK